MRLPLLVILLLILAVIFQLGLIVYALYALCGVILLGRLLADHWSQNLSATRQISAREVKLGEKVAVVVLLENHHWLPIPWLLLEDLLPRRALIHQPPNLEVQGRRLQLVSIRPSRHGKRATKTVLYQLTCQRRGYYQLGPLVAETGDVFGLYRRYRILSQPNFLLAYPKVIPLEGFDIASRRPIGEVRMTHRLYDDPTRIAGVRGYHAGDPLKRIHWQATARTGQLQSKVYEPSTIAGATLLVDFHESSFDPRHEPLRSELAITTAASIAGALVEMGQQVGLVTNGRDAADRIRTEGWCRGGLQHLKLQSRKEAREAAVMCQTSDRLRPTVVTTGRGQTVWREILKTLARLEKTDGLTLAELVRETRSQLPLSATVIALLTSVPPETAIVLGNLRRRGRAVTAILIAYEPYEFAELAQPLIAQRVEVRQLRDEASIPTLCSQTLLR